MKKSFLSFYLVCIFSIFPVASYAQFTVPEAHQRQALKLYLGFQGGYSRTELAYETPTLWQRPIFNRPFEVRLEAGIAYWHTNNNHVHYRSRTSLTQIGLTPLLRYWMTPQWYIEAGIGATMLSHTRFANKRFSTQFQFGDHLGIGRTLGNNWRASLRYSHFSNASIKDPNDGLNVAQLSLSRAF